VGEYTDLINLLIYLRERGICQWLVGGVLAQNAVHILWTTFCRAAEAAQGMIPVVTLHPSQAIPIASRNGEISWQPALEITGWVPREEATFGPRTVPPPTTRLGTDGAEAALPAASPAPVTLPQSVPVVLPPEQIYAPAASAVSQHPPQAATSSLASHYRPLAAAVPAQAPAAPPARDAFASMIPVAGAAPPMATTPAATAPVVATPTASQPSPTMVAVSAPSAAPKF
jgi:hypothetical protein